MMNLEMRLYKADETNTKLFGEFVDDKNQNIELKILWVHQLSLYAQAMWSVVDVEMLKSACLKK